MTTLIRRTLLVSSTAVLALALLPVIGAMAPASFSALVEQQAQARGGSDDGDDSSDDSGSDDSGSDDSGHGGGSSHDDSGDSSDDDGPDHDSNDDNGGDRADDDSDDSDDLDDDGTDDDGTGKSRGRGGNRDEIRLIVNDSQLQGLLSGTMIAIDQNGKRLRFEVEQEHGNTEIKLRAPKGTLTGVTVIPAP